MALTWKDYCGLRGINEVEYFRDNNILKYEDIVQNLNKHSDVNPPSQREFDEVVLAVEKIYGSQKKTAAPKPVVKSSPKTRVAPQVESTQKVDISKRSTTPKRSTRKKSTRRKTTPKE